MAASTLCHPSPPQSTPFSLYPKRIPRRENGRVTDFPASPENWKQFVPIREKGGLLIFHEIDTVSSLLPPASSHPTANREFLSFFFAFSFYLLSSPQRAPDYELFVGFWIPMLTYMYMQELPLGNGTMKLLNNSQIFTDFYSKSSSTLRFSVDSRETLNKSSSLRIIDGLFSFKSM